METLAESLRFTQEEEGKARRRWRKRTNEQSKYESCLVYGKWLTVSSISGGEYVAKAIKRSEDVVQPAHKRCVQYHMA